GDVDGEEEEGGEEGEDGEDGDEGDHDRPLAGFLVGVDEDGGDEGEDAEADGVGHPDEGGLDEGHLGDVVLSFASVKTRVRSCCLAA
ncbi:hypothetical protein LTR33_014270, partial [Friedmanniomyces endolithicus]